MKTGQLTRILVGVAASIVAITALNLIVPSLWVRRQLAPKVTAAHLEQLKPGMSVAHVLSVLGEPYFIASSRVPSALNTCGCPNPEPAGTFYATINSDTTTQQLLRRVAADSASVICNNGEKHHRHVRITTFLYSKEVVVGTYPMVRVNFDASLRVSEVYAMKYARCLGETDSDASDDAVTFYSVGSKWRPDTKNSLLMQILLPR